MGKLFLKIHLNVGRNPGCSLFQGKIKSVESDDIKFGATVEIEDDESGEKQQYQIVGEYESDIENKKLSITSPLARGLIGKTEEDNVEINSPKGLKSYTILSIKYI